MSLFDIVSLEKNLSKLEEKTTEPDFWNDSQNSSKVLGQIKTIKKLSNDKEKNKVQKKCSFQKTNKRQMKSCLMDSIK